MTGGGGGGCLPPPNGFSYFSSDWGELLFRTYFLAVGTSLGHLSMKKFSNPTYRVGPKIRPRDRVGGGVGGGGQPPWAKN